MLLVEEVGAPLDEMATPIPYDQKALSVAP